MSSHGRSSGPEDDVMDDLVENIDLQKGREEGAWQPIIAGVARVLLIIQPSSLET